MNIKQIKIIKIKSIIDKKLKIMQTFYVRIMQKLCKNYAKIMQKLCKNYAILYRLI